MSSDSFPTNTNWLVTRLMKVNYVFVLFNFYIFLETKSTQLTMWTSEYACTVSNDP